MEKQEEEVEEEQRYTYGGSRESSLSGEASQTGRTIFSSSSRRTWVSLEEQPKREKRQENSENGIKSFPLQTQECNNTVSCTFFSIPDKARK